MLNLTSSIIAIITTNKNRLLNSYRSSIVVLRKNCSENMQPIYRRTPIPMCDFNIVAKWLYWNHTSAWVFSCKFAVYFQNTFSWEHPGRAASVHSVSKYYSSSEGSWKTTDVLLENFLTFLYSCRQLLLFLTCNLVFLVLRSLHRLFSMTGNMACCNLWCIMSYGSILPQPEQKRTLLERISKI